MCRGYTFRQERGGVERLFQFRLAYGLRRRSHQGGEGFPPAQRSGRPRERDMREVMNAVRYVLRTGCQWRQLPKDFPSRSTVYSYFWEWSRYGVLDRIHHTLLVACREAEGREASPTAAIIDTRAVKATEKGAAAGIPLATTRARKSKASSATRLSIR